MRSTMNEIPFQPRDRAMSTLESQTLLNALYIRNARIAIGSLTSATEASHGRWDHAVCCQGLQVSRSVSQHVRNSVDRSSFSGVALGHHALLPDAVGCRSL